MKYIPEELFVGYKRQYKTEKSYLAYISSYIKGKASKQDSIECWRDKDIPTEILKNELLEGFILGEKAGDSGERKAWVRVLDPRGFEIEISIDNLLHILECEGCEKDKKLKGKFIYAFNEAMLLLLPESSPDYKELKKHTEALSKKNVTKDNIIPYEVYSNKSKELFMYLGRLDTYTEYFEYNGKRFKKMKDAENAYFNDHSKKIYYNSQDAKKASANIIKGINEKPEKHYWFFDGVGFRHTKTFPNYLVEHVTGEKDKFDMTKVNRQLTFSKELHKIVKQEWKKHSFEYFSKQVKCERTSYVFSREYAESYSTYSNCRNNRLLISYDENSEKYTVRFKEGNSKERVFDTLEQVYNYIKPEYLELTLDNGEHLRWCYDFVYYSKDSDLLN